MPKRTAQNPQPGWLRELVKIKPARKAMQLVGMSVTPFLVIALLAACAEQPTGTPVEETTPTETSEQYWFTSDRLNRHTCPSTDCGIVG